MSKKLNASQFESSREYEEAKRSERKQSRQFRDTRKGRKNIWESAD